MSEQLFRHFSVQAGDEADIIHVTVDGPCERLSLVVILQVCIFSVTVEGPCERLSLLFILQVCSFYFFVSSFVLFVFFLLSSGSPSLEAFLSLKMKVPCKSQCWTGINFWAYPSTGYSKKSNGEA